MEKEDLTPMTTKEVEDFNTAKDLQGLQKFAENMQLPVSAQMQPIPGNNQIKCFCNWTLVYNADGYLISGNRCKIFEKCYLDWGKSDAHHFVFEDVDGWNYIISKNAISSMTPEKSEIEFAAQYQNVYAGKDKDAENDKTD